MATRKKKNDPWSGVDRAQNVDGLFSAMRDQANKELGRNDICIGTELDKLFVGLQLPALSLRYFFQSSVFPLSLIIQITGEEGTAKTALALEIIRWHMVHGGGGVFEENENKYSPELTKGIMEWCERWLRRFKLIRTRSLEQWQDSLTTTLDIAKSQQTNPDGPGRTIPICWVVDSIMGTSPESTLDKIRTEGHASLGFPLAARLIAEYMRSMPDQIQDFPFTIVGTNHLKPPIATGPMQPGGMKDSIPGGKAVKFMETFEIKMKHDSQKTISTNERGGLRLRIINTKNSMGPGHKQIQASLLWWKEDLPDGGWRQQTAWDWHSATIQLWNAFEVGATTDTKGMKTTWKKMMDICDFRIVSKTTKMVYSNALGITKSEPVPYYLAAQMLEQRPELIKALHCVLGVTERKAFQPGVDYMETRAAELAASGAQTSSLYADIAALPVLGGDFEPVIPEAPTELSSEEIVNAEVPRDAFSSSPRGAV